MAIAPVRVRFAPSPTGELHLGGARTALFNYLFSRKNNGKFFLRIEDTDTARSKDIFIDQIIESLTSFGIKWDEPVIYQSKRFNDYRSFAEILVKNNKAYPCFCSKELIQKDREKGYYKYKGTCRELSKNEIKANFNQGRSFVYRFKTPIGTTEFNDMVYGSCIIDNDELDDFIIIRSDGSPTYNLSAVVDDHILAISHVIRGEDHLSNTSKQILLYDALSLNIPIFAHLPMILGSDKKRLSKRHGALGMQTFLNKGYLPSALMNYLALLGWNPGTKDEFFNIEELISKFSFDKIQKKPAVWDEKKLEWISSQHIIKESSIKILNVIKSIYPEWGVMKNDTFNLKVIDLMKLRVSSLGELNKYSQGFYNDPNKFSHEDEKKAWPTIASKHLVEKVLNILSPISDWSASTIEKDIKNFSKNENISFGKVIMPLRLAVFGSLKGPSLFEMFELIKKDAVLRRMSFAIKKISIEN